MGRQVTIKDIAKEAGVSIATVSMIMNQKDKNISDSTREKVREIASRRGYVPNMMARSLKTRKTRIIGLIIPDITNPFFPEIARGAEDMASTAGYSVIFCNTDDKLIREDTYIEILTEKTVDGIIFAHSADRADMEFTACRVPIVLIDRDSGASSLAGRVLVDNRKAAFSGVSYLIERGYRRIAYIAGSMTTVTARERLEGYRDALAAGNLDWDPALVKKGDYRSQWGYEAVKELRDEGASYEAVFCGNDLIAIGAMRALREMGKRVPEDMGVMGFDDIYLAGTATPPLTTVRQPIYDMGYQAAKILIDAIESGEGKKKGAGAAECGVSLILDTELIVRQSTR